MNIRKAVLADSKGIAKVHVDSWRTTYKNIIPDGFLKKLSYDRRTELWNENIIKKGNYVFVAENSDGKIIGFADCGKRESNHVPESGDLTAIYLLEEYQGKGVGKRLLRKVFLQFEELGFNRIFVEVLEDGAELYKTEKITIAGAELNLLIYEWNNIGDVLIKF